MEQEKEKDKLNYIEEAVNSFNEIMATKKKDITESFNRANKGELFVLKFLAVSKKSVLPSEISAALNVSTARISALLSNLEKKGQIEREIDKNNRRNILVTVTQTGRRHVKSEMKIIQENMALIFAEMGEEDTMEFVRLLKRFFEIFCSIGTS